VELKPLTKDESIDFLKKGFKHEDVDVAEGLIYEAVEAFDGIIGWLTHFGYNYVRGIESIELILDKSVNLMLTEIQHFLEIRAWVRPGTLKFLKRLRQRKKVPGAILGEFWSQGLVEYLIPH